MSRTVPPAVVVVMCSMDSWRLREATWQTVIMVGFDLLLCGTEEQFGSLKENVKSH